MSDKVPMTVRGHELLEAELKRLKYTDRPEVIAAIAEARGHGDLKENADYHAAKDEQGLNEARIRELESRLQNAVVANAENVPEDMVFIGATVKLRDVDSGNEECYRLVGTTSGTLDDDVIEVTPNSPLGEALIKARVGEVVRVALRRGPRQLEIVEIVGN